MPRKIEYPDGLKPFTFHGVKFSKWKEGDTQALADECPFCDSEAKFNVDVETSKWGCWKCGDGNATTFIRKLLDESDDATVDYSELIDSRKITEETLMQWGVCRSITTGDWLVPGYNVEGNVTQAYRYMKTAKGMRLLPTPGLNGHALHGVYQYDPAAEEVLICEGPWDGLAMWEALGKHKETEEGIKRTANQKRSMLEYRSVLAVPGASVFFDKWAELLEGRSVIICYDNDHPKQGCNGKTVPSTGYKATERLVRTLRGLDKGPREVRYLKWGEEGYDPKLRSGLDVRDLLTNGVPTSEGLAFIFGRLEEAPKEWEAEKKSKQNLLSPKSCTEYKVLKNSWKKAMKWTAGLDHAMAVMLSSIASTRCSGDQLWVKIIGPASSGKSTLCEALTTARKYVYSKDTFTGITSGYQSDQEGKENLSLVNRIKDKTLIINDGDTLLQLPNLPVVLSQLRAFYGRNLRTSYRNKMSADHEGINTTIILCGTSSLRKLDSSELGERFLDCVLMDSIDDELEDIIGLRKARKAVSDLTIESTGKVDTQYDPTMVEAMALTGGYVCWLRENSLKKLGEIYNSDAVLFSCARLGKFIAHMRARPSVHQEENAEREFSARLVSQLVRLANCLAVVLNRDSVDEEVLERVRQVALDTSRGQGLAITAHLYEEDSNVKTLSLALGKSESKIRVMLQFLRQIGVAESYKREDQRKIYWKLTDRMETLYEDALGLE